MSDQPEHKPIVRYKWEYSKFLDYVKGHKVQRAMIYAKMLGIDRRTMANWCNQPELREALAEAIDELIEGMQRAGKDDWRMYREMLKMAGLDDGEKLDLTSDGEKLNIVTVEFVDSNGNKKDKDKTS